MNRWTSFAVSLLIASVAGCTPSDQEPSPATQESADKAPKDTEMTEEAAIESARAEAAKAEFNLEKTVMSSREEDGNWLVTFSPDGDRLGAGFVVEFNKKTGEVIRTQFTQ